MTGDSVRLSDHARERCAEMGLPTRVAKRIVRSHDMSWAGAAGRTVAVSSAFPDLAVVYAAKIDPPVVVTVLWRTQDQYDRATYRPPVAGLKLTH